MILIKVVKDDDEGDKIIVIIIMTIMMRKVRDDIEDECDDETLCR